MLCQRLKSREIFERGKKVMVGGVNSPVRSFYGLDIPPIVVDKALGDLLFDVDGRHYTDFCCSWGALIHGHADPDIAQAVQDQLCFGNSYGAITPLEVTFATKLVALLPSLEKLRVVCSGTEATMSALRLARGVTGRPLVIKFNGHYHGHVDHLLVQAGSGVAHLSQASSKGVIQDFVANTLSLPFNDVVKVREAIRLHRDRLAAVIVEPIAGNMGVVPGTKAFLEMLREETEKVGAILIFDEVITGFRVGLEGAQGHFGITPDLTCLGKIVGGGFPLAVYGGRFDVMDALAPVGEVYQAGTLAAPPIALAAALAAIEKLDNAFYETLQHKADMFLKPIEQILLQRCLPIQIRRIGSMFSFFLGAASPVTCYEDLKGIDTTLFKSFFSHLFEEGIFFPPSPFETAFLSMSHTPEHLLHAQNVILNWIDQLK